MAEIRIKPQEGPQEQFLSTPADIAIYGGAAGGGKTYASILEPLRHINNPRFGAVIFRRTLPQITAEGGLWDEAGNVYPSLKATPKQMPYEWTFPSGSKITFSHLQHEKNIKDWQGSQIPLIIFDELTHFTEKQFWYLLSRNRSTCGVKPYVRATCNPDPDSFVAKLIAWWIDQETGYAIKKRSGVVRYFLRIKGELIWGESREECLKNSGVDPQENDNGPEEDKKEPKSFTFIASSLEDNKILMKEDPSYKANLDALPLVDREQLKKGNWKIRPASGLYFKRHYFEVVDSLPEITKAARGWDFAATSKEDNSKADHTAGTKMVKGVDGYNYITDLVYEQLSPGGVEDAVKVCASQDGKECVIRIPQDPGQAGKAQVDHYAKDVVPGYNLQSRTMSGDKVTRAGALSSAAEKKLVKLLRGPWNETFLIHAEVFPPQKGSPDIIDSAVEAFFELNETGDFFNMDL